MDVLELQKALMVLKYWNTVISILISSFVYMVSIFHFELTKPFQVPNKTRSNIRFNSNDIGEINSLG